MATQQEIASWDAQWRQYHPNEGVRPEGYHGEGGNSGSGNIATAQSYYQPIADEVNKYVDEIIAQAQGNYDFAAKLIESEYTRAAGTDNVAQKQFLQSVANELEAKIGRVAYDYQTNTYRTQADLERELGRTAADLATTSQRVTQDLGTTTDRYNQDFNTTTTRTNEDLNTTVARTQASRDQALARLAEDEKTLTDSINKNAVQQRDTLQNSLNRRGVIQGTLENAGGIAGNERDLLNSNIQDQLDALKRSSERSRQDTNTSADQTIADAQLASSRALENATTTKERGLFDVNTTANRQLSDAEQAANRTSENLNIAASQRLEDLTTTARRSAQDAEQARIDQIAAEQKKLEDAKLAAEQQRRSSLNQARELADYYARGALGTGGGQGKMTKEEEKETRLKKKQRKMLDMYEKYGGAYK